mmetsp:Transcript_25569/g.35288  ORF Transcript_25569/g.35288 Transcript_25569/m.35288 type:complete len:134 (-) Transcript_25569:307-708(-)|eukprot:CAMPEP_0196581030 /NCGR_PEP_ID=MMETSP1081-20130531/32017_1 /TAXON_ID=36882 /ORGANISM="Pyramimonas amylifera, Strain CCMP720" /LENGTH=133 /DNA_ID=CAMNT_0041901111 /DNA_START=104 /DNA_END=505 /DNA_ORIENTATION=-
MAPTIDLKSLDVSPNNCALSDPINLEMEFTSSEYIASGYWEIKYMVDMAAKRQIIELGKSDKMDYVEGDNKFSFHLEGINFDGVKKSLLTNVGLFLACLMNEGGEEIIQVSMVTQVMKQADGQLTRMIMSPIE